MIANILILATASLSVSYIGICIYAYLVADSLIFPVPAPSYKDDSNILKLETADGESISAYYLEAPEAKQLLLYSHGNGEDIGEIRPLLEDFQERDVSIFAYDYPGYGTSTGQPSEAGIFAAADAAYAYVTSELGFSAEYITLYGRSLGSGPSCWLAQQYPVKGLILDGGFTSTFRVISQMKILHWDVFDNLKRIPEIDTRILFLHGKEDRIVPFSHAKKNYERAKNAEAYWANSGHNSLIETMGDDYWKLVLSFIKQKD